MKKIFLLIILLSFRTVEAAPGGIYGTLSIIPRFVIGMLFCWQLDRNKYDLRNGIFAHA